MMGLYLCLQRGRVQQYSKDITNSNLASETHLSSEYLAGFAVLKILQLVR